jgi:hypothetical protein
LKVLLTQPMQGACPTAYAGFEMTSREEAR